MTALTKDCMHYYQHHIGDFIKDTNFLTNEEVGIYMKLIWLYYDTEKPLTNNLFLLSMKTNARESEATVQGILQMFFVLHEDEWHHTRCDKEIAEYADFCAKQKANGLKGGRPKISHEQPKENPTDSQLKPKETLTTNHYPLPTNHIKNIPIPEGMNVIVWSDYLKLRNKQKKPLTETALKGLQREADKAKMPLVDVLQTCCERGWIGFKADWIADKKVMGTATQEWRNNDSLMIAKATELGLSTIGMQRYDIINKIDAHIRSRGL